MGFKGVIARITGLFKVDLFVSFVCIESKYGNWKFSLVILKSFEVFDLFLPELNIPNGEDKTVFVTPALQISLNTSDRSGHFRVILGSTMV